MLFVPSNISDSDIKKALEFAYGEILRGSLGNNTKIQSRPKNGQNSSFQDENSKTYHDKRYAAILADFKQLKPLSDNSTTKKWQLKEKAEKLLPYERVSHTCMKWIAIGHDECQVVKNENGQHSFRHLQVCGSVWNCPICSARISEIRRKELAHAIGFSGYKTLLMTFTLQHHSNQNLKELLALIQSAYALFKSGRFYQDLKTKYRIPGTIKALEVTFGENGWHPHIHVLLVIENHEIDHLELQNECRTRWLHCVQYRGGWCNRANGLTVKNSDTFVQDYVSKFGKMPGKGDWDAIAEITKSVVKKAKRNGFTPFMLLELATQGSEQASRLFQEYAIAFKGKNQLQWSRGLKALLNIEEISDLQAAEMDDNASEREVVATISAMSFYNIVATNNRLNVLIAANELSKSAFLQYLSTFDSLYLWKAQNNELQRE